MRTVIITSLLLAISTILGAQNTYTTISQINTSSQWLRTPDAGAINTGDFLLIYQHGGATVNLSGTATGALNDVNGAGHYDLNKVARVGGDTVFLTLPLTNTYAVTASQLVVYPSAESRVVSNTATAAPFNGTTGGVLFLAAGNQLTINAPLLANGAGFRGGIGQEADSDCNRFTVAAGETYNLGNWRGSARGEGVAGIPAGQEAGRAMAANGGGGGNDHNAGGGGGANVAAGGIGARNIVDGLFNNACRGNFPGRGGRGLTASQDRVFLGGGGGAGHANNTTTANGGNGGGLVVLWAPNISFGDGGAVDASGDGPDGVNGDGGGGGGAGGSLLIVADTLSGNPSLDLSGGKGADVINLSDRCFGPGGGGSGGRLLRAAFSVANWSPDLDLSAGGFGQRLGSDACAAGDEPAGTGVDGSSQVIGFPVPFGGFVQSADTLCADGQLLLTDASNGAQAATWRVVPESEALTETLLGLSLRVNFADTASGTFMAIQTLIADGQEYAGDTAVFTVYPIASVAGGNIVFNDEFVTATVNNPLGFDAIRYDFGDGTVIDTNATSLTHLYSEGGDYSVSVTLLNANCGDLVVTSNEVSLAEFAVADADVKVAEGCAPFTLDVNDVSTGIYGSRRWDFPGSETPLVFDEQNPMIVYSEPGTYQGFLTLLDALGPDTVDQFVVIVNARPTANFSFSVDTAAAIFSATTDLADEFSWDFGDGSGSSTEQNPAYSYDTTGTFTVALTATLGPCSVTIEQEITIEILSDLEELAHRGIRLFPNPTSGELNLRGDAELVDVFDLGGRYIGPLSGQQANLRELPSGMYIVRLRVGGKVYSVRIRKR